MCELFPKKKKNWTKISPYKEVTLIRDFFLKSFLIVVVG